MSFDDRGDGNDDDDRFGRSNPYAQYLREFEAWRGRAARSGKGLVGIAAAVIALAAVATSFYQVQPEEVGQDLSEPTSTLPSGASGLQQSRRDANLRRA